MVNVAPETIITVAAFRNEAVNMRILFKVPTEGMQNHDKTRDKIFGFIHFEEHTGNNAGDRMEKTVKQRTILKEEITKVMIDGKNAVAMLNINELKRHRGSAVHGILVTAGRTETAVTAKRNEF